MYELDFFPQLYILPPHRNGIAIRIFKPKSNASCFMLVKSIIHLSSFCKIELQLWSDPQYASSTFLFPYDMTSSSYSFEVFGFLYYFFPSSFGKRKADCFSSFWQQPKDRRRDFLLHHDTIPCFWWTPAVSHLRHMIHSFIHSWPDHLKRLISDLDSFHYHEKNICLLCCNELEIRFWGTCWTQFLVLDDFWLFNYPSWAAKKRRKRCWLSICVMKSKINDRHERGHCGTDEYCWHLNFICFTHQREPWKIKAIASLMTEKRKH